VRRDSPAGRWLAAHPVPEGLARGPEFEDSSILEVKAGRPPVYVSAMLGFYPREYAGDSTWRWMGPMGALRIVATGDSAGSALGLELKAFPRDRRVEWFLNGRRLGELEVAAEWRRYDLPLGPLAPGEASLTLACREPAVAANDILHNGDPRALGLAVGSWRIADVGAARGMGASPLAVGGEGHRHAQEQRARLGDEGMHERILAGLQR